MSSIKAGDIELGRFVALKFLPDDQAQDQQALERFLASFCTAAFASSPAIFIQQAWVRRPERVNIVAQARVAPLACASGSSLAGRLGATSTSLIGESSIGQENPEGN